eukprot:6208157-Pleurochrysis_carterae.AAC.2
MSADLLRLLPCLTLPPGALNKPNPSRTRGAASALRAHESTAVGVCVGAPSQAARVDRSGDGGAMVRLHQMLHFASKSLTSLLGSVVALFCNLHAVNWILKSFTSLMSFAYVFSYALRATAWHPIAALSCSPSLPKP